ncbi:phosphate transport system regulatory protein PhoU [Candidatus Bathyarchaeota archaeon RBG_13_38_9]|nr:MAG: phosphate transport system regulatory protein PhoU [Candidatus Bathyarchaeota archaeon RBG_13_38_9]
MSEKRLLDSGLNDLADLLDDMCKLATDTVSASIQAYLEGGDVFIQVRQWSDTLFNLHTQVGDKAIELIARYQPVATDLRLIKASIEISYDLSRFGRYAYDISTILKKFNGTRMRVEYGRDVIAEMGERTMSMIKSSIKAYRTKNIQLAEKVGEDDKEIDEIYLNHLKYSAENPPQSMEQLIADILTVRHLERIADHAVDLSSSVIYMITGKPISGWR